MRVCNLPGYRTAHAQSEDLSALALLVEVVGSLKITGSLEIVSCLLEILNKVASNSSPDAVDKRFIEQLLMSAIENVVGSFPVRFM